MHYNKYRKQIIFMLDLSILIFTSAFLLLAVPPEQGSLYNVIRGFALCILCITVMQAVLKTYDTLWRYASVAEYLRLTIGVGLGFLFSTAMSLLFFHTELYLLYSISLSSISLVGMITMRFLYRQYRFRSFEKMPAKKIPVAIIGAGEAGIALAKELISNKQSTYMPYCFFDDDKGKLGKFIHGKEVKGPINDLADLLKNTPVYDIVLAIPTVSPQRQREILELCSKTKCNIMIVPSLLELVVSKKDLASSMRTVRVEDLLGRDEISFDINAISPLISGKTVLITGGGGSIGSELCRQVASVNPKRLVILDIYENNAYDIQQELVYRYGKSLDLAVEIASVRDQKKMEDIFNRYHPQIVFHAAAHKHVPLMEECPSEAVKNNIFGTYNMVNLSQSFGVEKFVFISTDKAVNPTNVMGATKRFSEMILQSKKGCCQTNFVAVRFGNVLGSNGSVVPLFKKQIDSGGPLTITDKRITRYFMTIPEAVQLVLQAGAMADDGEVFVLDMGQPVKIIDLAENFIRLSGYTPGKDIQIVEIGLRPGEKLYEELLISGENIHKTENRKIFIEEKGQVDPTEIEKSLKLLRSAIDMDNPDAIISVLHKVVPTFKTPEEINSAALGCTKVEKAVTSAIAV